MWPSMQGLRVLRRKVLFRKELLILCSWIYFNIFGF